MRVLGVCETEVRELLERSPASRVRSHTHLRLGARGHLGNRCSLMHISHLSKHVSWVCKCVNVCVCSRVAFFYSNSFFMLSRTQVM